MRDIERIGSYQDIVEAPSPENRALSVRLGIRPETFQQYHKRGLWTPIAQFYGIVQHGIAQAQHLFRGLKRPLMLSGDMNADKTVLAYTWRPLDDYEWAGDQFDGWPVRKTPPLNEVFVVLVREEEPNEHSVFGSIEHWNWVREDPELPDAPVDWRQRYDGKRWGVSL